ncbi:MAG: hypothetical protein ACLP1Y_08235 [Candidatus Acidiferrales bacterium]
MHDTRALVQLRVSRYGKSRRIGGWLVDVSLEEHCSPHVDDTVYLGTKVYETKEIAAEACFISGRRIIGQAA